MEQDRLGKLVASSPINAPIELIRETLPPTLIQVGEAELLVSPIHCQCTAGIKAPSAKARIQRLVLLLCTLNDCIAHDWLGQTLLAALRLD